MDVDMDVPESAVVLEYGAVPDLYKLQETSCWLLLRDLRNMHFGQTVDLLSLNRNCEDSVAGKVYESGACHGNASGPHCVVSVLRYNNGYFC